MDTSPKLAACIVPGPGSAERGECSGLGTAGWSQLWRAGGTGLFLCPAVGKTGGGELLTVAAALDKSLFQGSDLAVEQEVRLVNQADKGI